MPDGQEQQGSQMTEYTVIQELQTLVNVNCNPVVRLDVERIDVVAKFASVFEYAHLDVGASRQLIRIVLSVARLGIDVG